MSNLDTKYKGNHPTGSTDWFRVVTQLAYVTTRPLIEIFHGLKAGRLPISECLAWASGVGVLIILRADLRLMKALEISRIYPRHAAPYIVYCLVLMGSGFWFWGLLQSALRTRLIRRLTEVFIEAGLKSPLGKLPAFVFDVPVDEFTRKLRLGRGSFSREQFEAVRPTLESSLQVYIDEMRENRERGSLDIIYSHSPMPTLSKIEAIREIPRLSFVVGKTRAKQITTSLTKVPHLMVAGQTGGGKSTYLRSFITTLFLNNTDFEFTLIDLKGGLEFQTFEKLPRIKVIPTVASAITQLKTLEGTLTERIELLKLNDSKDLEAFLAIKSDERKYPKNSQFGHSAGRHILVVDEAAEMFLAGAHADASEIQVARRVLSQIARQGRSVGVHLVIATQRPDAKALDPQVKANLTGVICFQMLNDASSISVLGVGRATELPPVPGRAIWKWGSEMTEVQTPYLGTDEVDQLLEEFRLQPKGQRKDQ